MRKVPWITIGLSIMMVGLLFLPMDIQFTLYLKAEEAVGTSGFTWITGHFIHADLQHLTWNVIAFLVLGGIVEVRSRILMLSALVGGMVMVDLLLLSPLSDVQYYCGFSGVLNTLMGVALWVLWKETQSKIVLAMGVATALKIAVEVMSGEALLTQLSWPPYPWSHLAGFVATPLVFLLIHKITECIKGARQLSGPLSI